VNDLIALLAASTIVVLMIAAVTVSTRRNQKAIQGFEYPDLDQLVLCVRNHRIKWTEKKMGSLGWELVSAEIDSQDKLSSRVRFRKGANDAAAPIKEVLHSLNRSLALPAGPFELKRDPQDISK
jgi:hypothetical protein